MSAQHVTEEASTIPPDPNLSGSAHIMQEVSPQQPDERRSFDAKLVAKLPCICQDALVF